ncbi:MAG: TonB-dependent receptor [Betaproteobacteria bacterium]|nr:MAG: TonB-dependent receptor [Betaproteobacteria bacterium]
MQSHAASHGRAAATALVAAAALGLGVAAQGNAQTGVASPEATAVVIVTATRSPAAALAVPASVSVVSEAELRRRNVLRLGDAIADVPGLYVRGAALGGSFPGSGTSILSLRGIPRTPRTLVMIDGQPLNNALSGGVNVAGIPFESLARVEVVRGPYSALYGGNAMGGVIHFISAGPDAPLSEMRFGAGNLGQRGAAIAHRKRYAGGLGVTLSAGYRESDGYPDSDYVIKQPAAAGAGTLVSGARATSTPDGTPAYWIGLKGPRPWTQSHAQLALHFSPAAATHLSAGFASAQYTVGYSPPETFLRDGAGVPVTSGSVTFADNGTRRLQLAESDFLTLTPSSERDLRAFARLEHRFSGGSLLRANASTLRHRFDFAQPASGVASYAGGPGEFTDQPNRRVDYDVALRAPLRPDWVLVGGGAFNRSTLERRTATLGNWRDDGTQGSLRNAGRGRSSNAALFIQSEHALDAGVTVYFGGRYDRYETDGEVIQNAAPAFTQSYAERSYDQFSPKLALLWQARPWLSLRASYGEGFRPPALLDLYSRTVLPTATAGVSSVNEPAPQLKPERVRSVEIGADAALAGGAAVSVALYAQQLSDLIYRRRLSAILSRTENAGAADVNGIEASLRWPTGVRGLAVLGSATHQFRYHITRNEAVPASVGKVLTDVPRTALSLGLDLQRPPWSGFIVYRQVGHVFGSGDDLNRNSIEGVYGSYDGHGVVNAKIGYALDSRVDLSLAIDNLADRQYFVFNQQPGRTFYGELAYRF